MRYVYSSKYLMVEVHGADRSLVCAEPGQRQQIITHLSAGADDLTSIVQPVQSAEALQSSARIWLPTSTAGGSRARGLPRKHRLRASRECGRPVACALRRNHDRYLTPRSAAPLARFRSPDEDWCSGPSGRAYRSRGRRPHPTMSGTKATGRRCRQRSHTTQRHGGCGEAARGSELAARGPFRTRFPICGAWEAAR